MDALAEDKDIRFLQVRHEETGALAAVMQAKFGGSIGVAVGSGGPGATHLINGVYDAAMDNTPFLAILGSRPVNELNMDAFQELNQNPMYNGIAVYNKRVAYAEQLPKHIGLCEKIQGYVLCNSSISSLSIFLYKSEKT